MHGAKRDNGVRIADQVMHECNALCDFRSQFFSAAVQRLFFQSLAESIWLITANAGCEGPMEELIGRLVANVGVDRTAAATAVGIILQFLVKEGPADKVQTLIDKLPGAGAAIKAAPPDANSAGMFGGGLMAAGSRMMAAGLSMSEVQAVTRETIGYAREKAGEDAVGEIVGAIPGLGQFV